MLNNAVISSIVDDEMECFGVHLWLAHALNINRGIQKHPGRATAIKHYTANS